MVWAVAGHDKRVAQEKLVQSTRVLLGLSRTNIAVKFTEFDCLSLQIYKVILENLAMGEEF